MRIFALLVLAPSLAAYPVSPRSFAALDSVPVFAVCTIERVTKTAAHDFEARVLIHRVHFASPGGKPFGPGDHIAIHYTNPDPPPAGGGFAGPFIFLDLQIGETVLLPLDGHNSVQRDYPGNPAISALPTDPGFAPEPASGAAFVSRELAHIFAHAEARQKSQAAAYLTTFYGEIPDDLPRLLTAALGRDDDAWLEAGCAFLGVLGIPRNNAELVYSETSPPFHDLRHLITWMLWKGDRRDYPNRLIRRLLRNSNAYAWGGAMTLVDFKDSTTLIDELNAGLRRNQPGSMTIAATILRAGQPAVLPEAIAQATRLIERDTDELQPAAQVLIEQAADHEFEVIPATLARWKHTDETRYRKLWGVAGYDKHPRALRLAAILIDDRRPVFGMLRYCDLAASVVEMQSGLKLGAMDKMPLAGRDAAVASAAAWLKAHAR